MDMGLKGKTAVITASSLGLGKAMAQGLAQEGIANWKPQKMK